MTNNVNSSDFHLAYNPKLIERAKELRKNMTPAEKKLWCEYLRNFKFRVLRQRPINHFIVDFYCPTLQVVIEVDGDSHFTDDGHDYDIERTRILKGYGLKIIRFTNSQVLNQFDTVCEQIQDLMPLDPIF